MRALGGRGMVASPHYLATGAGVAVLRQGGTAVDAIIATNAVLAVVTPYLCGIGGDLFAQVYTRSDGRLVGLNGSGHAAAEATVERVRQHAGSGSMPSRGPLTVTVPGCVEAWSKLHERYGRLSLRHVLADAIHYAEHGFPVSATFARTMKLIAPILHPDTPARETFLPGGQPPVEGQIFRQTRIARTLSTIAHEGTAAYYTGEIGREIARSLRAVGGLLSDGDLAEHESEWVEPLSLRYRDTTIYELPPNSQGVIALLMLNILNQVHPDSSNGRTRFREDRASGPPLVGNPAHADIEYVHVLAEVARLAYADREAFLTDPAHMSIDPQSLLGDEYGKLRAALVTQRAAAATTSGTPGDTIYCCAADADGNLVSLIESNFMGIGSGIMAGETGIMLQNRGAWFSLDPEHVNVIGPRKRTMHTLMPAMAFREGRPWLVFGTMGGSAQAQIHVEILTRLIEQGKQLDEAIDAPRFDAVAGTGERGMPTIALESRFSDDVVQGLLSRGHDVTLVEPYSSRMGHAHAIEILEDGTYVGAADPRAESLALGY